MLLLISLIFIAALISWYVMKDLNESATTEKISIPTKKIEHVQHVQEITAEPVVPVVVESKPVSAKIKAAKKNTSAKTKKTPGRKKKAQ